MSPKQTVTLSSKRDRWRYVCPRGHRSWEPTNHHFWCVSCSRAWTDTDPEFDELRDVKTGAMIDRDRLFLEGYDR